MDFFEEISPDYAGGWLGDVLPGVLTALGMTGLDDRLGLAAELAGVRQVAVVLVDGLGWHQLRFSRGVLGELGARRRPITCGFPSTTPTSLVSLGTGAVSGAHGVLAFTSLVPGTDVVLNHTLWQDDPDPFGWQPVPLLLDRARAAGLSTAVVNRSLYAGSGLTRISTGMAGYRAVADSPSGMDAVLAALGEGVQVVYGYMSEVDRAGHDFGAGTPISLGAPEWHAALSLVDSEIARLLDCLPTGAALVVTADHGHLVSPWEHRIDLDSVPDLVAGVRAVAGDPRVRYLHTVPGAQDDVLAAWRELAGHVAWIGSRAEAIATGWYGAVPRPHAERLGDVVVVGRTDWSFQATAHESPRVIRAVGLHGGRTRLEMEIPLLIAAM